MPNRTQKKAKHRRTTVTRNNSSSKSLPSVRVMVNAAIRKLKDPGGSSLPAVKKFIETKYNVDSSTLSSPIKEYIKKSICNGTLSQAAGVGARGSFKLVTKAQTSKQTTKKRSTTMGCKSKSLMTSPDSKTPKGLNSRSSLKSSSKALTKQAETSRNSNSRSAAKSNPTRKK